MQLVLWKPPGDFVKDVVEEMSNPEPTGKPPLSSSSTSSQDVAVNGTPDVDISEMEFDCTGGMELGSAVQNVTIPAASNLSL